MPDSTSIDAEYDNACKRKSIKTKIGGYLAFLILIPFLKNPSMNMIYLLVLIFLYLLVYIYLFI